MTACGAVKQEDGADSRRVCSKILGNIANAAPNV
jgi:hypothetical protein